MSPRNPARSQQDVLVQAEQSLFSGTLMDI
jgi:hypothetical protein